MQQGQYELAKKAASDYRDIFGPENFYCELMDHGIDIELRHRDDLLRLARELQLPLLATNDLHYTYAKDWEAHEVLLCVQTGKTMADPNRLTMGEGQLYLKTPQEMREVWRELSRKRVTTRSRSPSAFTSSSMRARTSCRTSPFRRVKAKSPGW